MSTFKEAGTGLFSLFDTKNSLNVYQKSGRGARKGSRIVEIKIGL